MAVFTFRGRHRRLAAVLFLAALIAVNVALFTSDRQQQSQDKYVYEYSTHAITG